MKFSLKEDVVFVIDLESVNFCSSKHRIAFNWKGLLSHACRGRNQKPPFWKSGVEREEEEEWVRGETGVGGRRERWNKGGGRKKGRNGRKGWEREEQEEEAEEASRARTKH